MGSDPVKLGLTPLNFYKQNLKLKYKSALVNQRVVIKRHVSIKFMVIP